jgi:hypothetical protein
MKIRSALCVLLLAVAAPLAAWAQVSLRVDVGPPPLLAYAQPPLPGEGYLWTPGYWAWSQNERNYFWVPGTWVLAPAPGALWTPGYWAFDGGGYLWHMGYWADRVGFYGGINYGYGYGGFGYNGGRWNGGVFNYNRAYNNVDTRIAHHVYNQRVGAGQRSGNAAHVSFNGGPGGVGARPRGALQQAPMAHQIEPTSHQIEHERAALAAPAQRLTSPRGAPQVAATPHPSGFGEPGVVHSRADAAQRQGQARAAAPAPVAAVVHAPAAVQQQARPPAQAERPQQQARAPAQAEHGQQHSQERGQAEGRGGERQQH